MSLEWIEQAPVGQGVDALDDYLNKTLSQEVGRNSKEREQFVASMQIRPASTESIANWVEGVHRGLYQLGLERATQFRAANKSNHEPTTAYEKWVAESSRARPYMNTPDYHYGVIMTMRKMLETFGLKDEAYTIDYLFDKAEAVDATSGSESVIEGTVTRVVTKQ